MSNGNEYVLDDSDSDNNNIAWNDSKLREAYAKAILMANEHVAKRIAMSTNKPSNSDKPQAQLLNEQAGSSAKPAPTKEKKDRWRTGMSCRAIYNIDGLEYEAIITKVISDKECVVKFIGYNNSEVVPLKGLKQTRGPEECSRQIQQAHEDRELNSECDSDRKSSRASTEKSSASRHKKSSKTKMPSVASNPHFLPFQNLTLPTDIKLLQMDFSTPPAIPPPIPFPTDSRLDSEEQAAVSSMLMSWYMTGYYTGFYQGIKGSKSNARNN